MQRMEPIELEHEGARLAGVMARPEGAGPFPAVLVMHSAMGLNGFYRGKPPLLAEQGYLTVATNMYDESVDLERSESYGTAYQELMENPGKLRARLTAWLDVVARHPDVDAARIAAIGYCFGGHCVLELARDGADLKAAISYHGTLKTHAPARPGAIRAHVAAYCGAEDPYAPMEDVTALRKELDAAGARYTMHVFGGVAHSFTDPDAAKHDRPGIRYDAVADRVSWAGTLALLGEVLR